MLLLSFSLKGSVGDNMQFQDIINRDMILLNPGDSLEKALRSLKQAKLNMLPVVNDQKELIGVLQDQPLQCLAQ